MDSQLTLVNPAPPPSLIFSSTSLRNTHIYLSSDPTPRAPRWTVATDNSKPGTGTRVYEGDGEPGSRMIAVLYLKDVLPDVITFPASVAPGGGDVKVKVNKWLRKAMLADNYPIRILSPSPEECYYWKTDQMHRLALYNDRDHQYPLATFSPSPSSPCALTVSPEVEPIIESVLVSFIYLELKMRIKENIARVAQSRGLADYR
ncbi:hypothetical protein FIBSPDRAFT_1049787 [Athelia psychrophila]|uniref:DUF6593 domain-containing protein n=1 Tax=Athelia psychrophila TaxID=1759441 RepID=A0A166BPS7_9AGAM|nr:hypothetical protein FIBSPDRAFT_1049787 [Fibularhizoctonia sp. CBS 109695]